MDQFIYKKWLKRIFSVLAVFLGFVLTVLLLFFLLLQTGAGKGFLQDTLNRRLVWADGQVVVDGFSGIVPFNFKIQHVTVHDRQGEWLDIEDIDLHWSPIKLLLNRSVDFFTAGAQVLDIKRLPEVDEVEEEPFKLPEAIGWHWPLPAVRVERFYLREIRVPVSIADESPDFSLQAGLRVDGEGFSLPFLELNRLDRPGTELQLEAAWRQPDASLYLHAWLQDSQTLASLTGIDDWPETVFLNLSGQGPWPIWQGALRIHGDDFFDINFDVAVAGLDSGSQLRLDGKTSLEKSDWLPEIWREYAEKVYSAQLVLGMDPAEQQVAPALRLRSDFFQLSADTLISLSDSEVEGNVELTVFDGGPIWRQTGLDADFPLSLRMRGSGNLNQLDLNAELCLDGFRGYGVEVDKINLESEVYLCRNCRDSRLDVDARLGLAGFVVDGYRQLPAEWQTEMSVEYDLQRLLQIKNFHLASDDKEVLFSGEMDILSQRFSGVLSADIPEMISLLPPQIKEIGLTGDLILNGELEGDIAEKHYAFDPRLRVNNFSHPDTLITDFTGREISAAASLRLGNNNDLSVSHLNVDLKRASLTGDGTIDIGAEEAGFVSQLNIHDISWLNYHIDHQVAGEIAVDMQVKGTFAEPELDLSVDGKGLAANQFGPFDLTALTSASLLNGMPRGDLTGKAQGQGEEIEFGLAYVLDNEELSLRDILITGAGMDLAGDLYLTVDQWLAEGELKMEFADLRRTGDFISFPLQGLMEADLSLVVDERGQHLDLSMTGQDLQVDSFSLTGLEGRARLRDLHGIPSFNTRLRAVGGQRGDISFDDCVLELQGVPEQIEFSAELDGYMAAPLQLTLAGAFSADAEDRELILTKWQGRFADMDYSLREPARLVHSDKRTQLDPLQISLADGVFSLAGERREQLIEGELKMEDLDFASLHGLYEFPLNGEWDLLMQLGGNVEFPELTGSLTVDNLSSYDERLVDLEELSARLEIKLAGGFFDFAASVRDVEQTIFQSELRLPVEWSLDPVSFEISDPCPLEGMIRGELEMERPAAALLPPDHIFDGFFSLDLSLSGELQAPKLQGNAELTDGYYENFAAGVILNNLGLRFTAEEDTVKLRELKADDGGQGELSGEGSINLSPANGLPWELDLTMHNFRLLRHRLITADAAQGEVRLAGDEQAGEIKGKIEFQRVEVAIAEPSPPEVVDLKVREVNSPRNDVAKMTERAFEEEDDRSFFPLALDLQLKFPARVFVRGHGLDSEWQGELTAGGAVEDLHLEGQLSVIRGRMELLGRRFTLDRESFVNFDGGMPIDPAFDILAFYRRRGRQIGVRVFGTASMPELELSSDPPMPQDEILAWVLFGRSVASLTPLQALQLANAAASLARGDAGWDLMGRARALLGVDELDIMRDEDGGMPRLGMGRYVHERVYMQMRTGLGPADEILSVEVELTPRIILESNVGADREGGIGIFWRYDY